MWTNSGVSQNSRGATRFANVTVNGRATTIDTAAATASVAGMSAGTYRCSAVAGSAYATARQRGEEHERGHAEGVGGGGTAVAGEPDDAEPERDCGAGLPAEQRRSGRVGDPGGETAELAHLWLLRGAVDLTTCHI